VPVETRITQIAATIDRIRARPQAAESRFILVNLPAYTLFAVDKGQTQLIMRVIIGNRKNHTPLFDNAVTDVIFNPQWHVPERIARKELTPKLREDPAYFVKAGFVVTQDGEPIDPLHARPDDDKFTFRQLAGGENALGKIKFNIPDSDNIYLHSTATPRLFAKDDRALSHGCIRVEDPRALAYFMFDGKADWDKKRIDKTYDGDAERWVKVEATPVHLVYWTAFVDAAGAAYFYPDVYGKDTATTADNDQKRPVTLAAQ
jgi:murein L,D-transpeptidase YcbB/YkuD